MTHADIEFLSNHFDSITCLSSQERIALGSRGFYQGIHYWEFTIQCYDDKSDPAFGIARFDVSKENMLGKTHFFILKFLSFFCSGKDSKSWCMYIDNQRSWFMHNGQHINRINGGISIGSIVGVLLDLKNGRLSFYINGQRHGEIAFSNLIQGDVYYPAVSLNKNVQLTLASGLDLPLKNA
jgi:tripartite motif-containing protein 9/67